MRYNRSNRYLFVNDTEIIKFNAKGSEISAAPLWLGNISEGFSADNIKEIGLNGYVYDFSVGYDAIAVYDKQDIHRCWMKKNRVV